MKLVKLNQPSDFRFQGRTIYVNPEDVMRVTCGEEYEESLIKLRGGECFTVAGKPEDIAALFQDISKSK